MSKPFLSVIIPTHNNKKEILMTLLDVYRHLEHQHYPSEIIVIDDGSTDGTVEMINRYTPLIDSLKLIDNKHHKGTGFVIKQAMLLAKGQWRVVLSPENNVSVVEFNKALPYAKDGYEIFYSPAHHFQCFSAKAAENIFTVVPDKMMPALAIRLAKKNGYKIKLIDTHDQLRSGSLIIDFKPLLAHLKRLWHNLT